MKSTLAVTSFSPECLFEMFTNIEMNVILQPYWYKNMDWLFPIKDVPCVKYIRNCIEYVLDVYEIIAKYYIINVLPSWSIMYVAIV